MFFHLIITDNAIFIKKKKTFRLEDNFGLYYIPTIKS